MERKPLILFDLDQTLLTNDSDYLWGLFLVEKGIVSKSEYAEKVEKFLEAYHAGTLDIYEYFRFQLHPFTIIPRERLEEWRKEFLEKKIRPVIPDLARKEVHHALKNTTYTVLITAANSFISKSIAEEFGIDHLIATDLEEKNGTFTGKVDGIACFQEGKVKKLDLWLKKNDLKWEDFSSTRFYSDSYNDLPLFKKVQERIAIDPDPRLRGYAEKNGWKIRTFGSRQ